MKYGLSELVKKLVTRKILFVLCVVFTPFIHASEISQNEYERALEKALGVRLEHIQGQRRSRSKMESAIYDHNLKTAYRFSQIDPGGLSRHISEGNVLLYLNGNKVTGPGKLRELTIDFVCGRLDTIELGMLRPMPLGHPRNRDYSINALPKSKSPSNICEPTTQASANKDRLSSAQSTPTQERVSIKNADLVGTLPQGFTCSNTLGIEVSSSLNGSYEGKEVDFSKLAQKVGNWLADKCTEVSTIDMWYRVNGKLQALINISKAPEWATSPVNMRALNSIEIAIYEGRKRIREEEISRNTGNTLPTKVDNSPYRTEKVGYTISVFLRNGKSFEEINPLDPALKAASGCNQCKIYIYDSDGKLVNHYVTRRTAGFMVVDSLDGNREIGRKYSNDALAYLQNLSDNNLHLIDFSNRQYYRPIGRLYYFFTLHYGTQCQSTFTRKGKIELTFAESNSYGITNVDRSTYIVEEEFSNPAINYGNWYVGGIREYALGGGVKDFIREYGCNSKYVQNVRKNLRIFGRIHNQKDKRHRFKVY